MNHDMLQIDDEIHRHDRSDNRDQRRYIVVVEDTPTQLGGKSGHANGSRREKQPQHETVYQHKGQVIEPTHGLGDRQHPARCGYFPDRHNSEDAKKETKTDGHLVFQDHFVEIHGTRSCW